MAKLRLTAAARDDLQRIGDDGERDHGSVASAAHIEGFRRLFRLLTAQPSAGQVMPGLVGGSRSLSHRPHRILYRIEGDVIVIDRIIHQARDIGHALQEDH